MNQVTLRRIGTLAAACCAAALIAGCDWQRAGDDNTWNDTYNAKYSWVDFSGVYEDPDGGYIVRAFVPPGSGSSVTYVTNSSGGSTGTGVQTLTLGTGNGIQSAFGGNLAPTPVIPGSLTIRGILPGGNVETFTDDNSGALKSNLGNPNIGTINYLTGAYTVTFLFPVQPGTDVTATYISGQNSSLTNSTTASTVTEYNGESTTVSSSSLTNETTVTTPQQSGSTEPIFTFSIIQDAYKLTFRDNYGNLYSGRIRDVTTTGGGDNSTTKAATVVTATFEVSGNGIVISGVLEADYTPGQQPQTVTGLGQAAAAPPAGTLKNRVIRGVWMEHSGDTGDIVAVSREPAVAVSSTSTNAP